MIAIAHGFYKREPLPSLNHVLPILLCYGLVMATTLFIARDRQLTLDGLEAYIKDAMLVLIVVLNRAGVLPTLRGRHLGVAGRGDFSRYDERKNQQLTGDFANNYWGFAQTEVEHIIGKISSHRIAGPIETNFYAMIMLALVPLALDRVWSERAIWAKGIAAYVALACVLTVIFTFSRGGFLGLGVATLVWAIQRRINLRTIVIGGLCCLLLLLLAPTNYTGRLSTLAEVLPFVGNEQSVAEISLRGRLGRADCSLAYVFTDHPSIGVGYDNFDVNYLEYSEEIGLDNRRAERQAHNLYLEIAAETGAGGSERFCDSVGSSFSGLTARKTDIPSLGQR